VTATVRSGLVNLAPGKDAGLHSKEKNQEMLVILEGQEGVEMEGFGRLKIATGWTAFVSPKTQHNVFNRGNGPLKCIFIVSNAIDEEPQQKTHKRKGDDGASPFRFDIGDRPLP
jgi:mannose-6-phosphate isomerase-like protein (cupin superfamily)